MQPKPANNWAGLQATAAPTVARATSAADISRHLEALYNAESGLPADTLTWLGAGFREFRDSRGERTVEECLGIAPGPGERSWGTREAFQRRDSYILAAWEALGPAPAANKPRAEALGAEINKFAEIFWPAWKERDAPPSDVTPLRKALFGAFREGDGEVPASWRQLARIVEKARGLS